MPLSEHDIYLFREGTHAQLAGKLGCALAADGRGAQFAVWAPNARRVEVIGDWNGWQPAHAALQLRTDASGIWQGTQPDARRGQRYKYRITARDDAVFDKTDPYGIAHETPPGTASQVWSLDYDWGDATWMRERAQHQALDAPIAIYELHMGSWRRRHGQLIGYRELAPLLTDYLLDLGFTHVELLPLTEHPFYGSWGYATTGYFAPTARYGTPQDLMYLIDHLHRHDIGVILDWVPAHFPDDAHGLVYFDGTHLYEHADPHREIHPESRTLMFDYGRNEVRSFLLSAERFWLDHYHVDALRADVGGLGFGYKWNMGWMHDTLDYFQQDPILRKSRHRQLTFSLTYAFSENFILPLSHDEVVHGKGSLLHKMPGDEWQKFANLRALYGYCWGHPGKKLLFMGGEFAQRHEWQHDEELDWSALQLPPHAGVQRLIRDLNRLYRREPALHELDASADGFQWLDVDDADISVIAFLRKARDRAGQLLVVCNLTPVPRANFLLGVPLRGRWRELLNTDARDYGGSGWGNLGIADTVPVGSHGQLDALTLQLPPLATLWLKWAAA